VFAQTTLSGNATYVGKQYFDNDQANTFARQMPAYTTVDMKLAHREGAWTLAAGLNNLFNRQYFTYGVASSAVPGKYNAYPMQGRSVSVNASYQF
jgi:iron complex outermembrane receptor protein